MYYPISQDGQVQAYEQLRKKILAQEAARKNKEKLLRLELGPLVSRQPGPSFEAAREEEQVGSFIASSPAALRSSLLIDGECSHAASEGDHFGNSC